MIALTGKPFATKNGGTAEGRRWVEEDGVHIDVRGLPAPGPLVAILTLVESMGDATPLIVHHDRDPIMLYAELAELGWAAERIDAPPGEVRLKLERLPMP